MRHEIIIPHQGFTTEYVTISKVYVKTGDQVNEGMPVIEMESDKATMDVESTCNGKVVSVLKNEGDEANVGETIIVVEE